jgi:exonuclease III
MLEEEDNYFRMEPEIMAHELDDLMEQNLTQQENIDQIYDPNLQLSQNQHVGDVMKEQKQQGRIRMYCINLNGIKWDKHGGNWPEICQAMEACNADIVGLVELNQDVGRYELNRKMDEECRKFFKHHQLITATSSHKVCNTYKPGGTALLVCNDMKAQIKSWHRDRMGRWVSIRVTGSGGQCITIISAYQVCKTITRGTNTTAAQQQATILEESINSNTLLRPTPRKAFIQELCQHIMSAQQQGDSIVLSGDFNETMTETNSGMEKLATTCGLVDIFKLRLGDAHTPTTYQRATENRLRTSLSQHCSKHSRSRI